MEGKFIGVVAAEVNSVEQRQIVSGIIHRARAEDVQVVVFSNLYNPYDYNPDLALENEVYQLIFSPQLCGIVLIEESFINDTIRSILHDLLAERQDIPVAAIGVYVPELDFPNVTFLDADDERDAYEITEHLLKEHHLTRVEILTGFAGNPVSERRAEGYRRAMADYGLPCPEQAVHYGNFWTNSGEELAQRYLSGELAMPEAVFCANDYMAYGLLDTFLKNGVRVPEDIIIVGYEYIRERIYHAPLLSTYQRGRSALGELAVENVLCRAKGEAPPAFQAPKGMWVPGDSCGCGPDPEQIHTELETLRVTQQYDKWNVIGTMEQQLTLCSNLEDFIRILGEHQFLVRYVQNMYLCLCEHWYDTSMDTSEDMLTCRSVMPWFSEQPSFTCHRHDFSALLPFCPTAAVRYYLPLFFEKHFFGYYVLEYQNADTYDDIFRNWMKSISNGLAFLCMKNDIRYLLQCQNLSAHRDSLTGLYNLRGFETALSARLSGDTEPKFAIAVKLGVLQQDVHPEKQAEHAQALAELMKGIAKQSGICGRLSPQIFVVAGFSCPSLQQCELLRQKLVAVLISKTDILETAGLDSVLCVSAELSGTTAAGCVSQLQHLLQIETVSLARQKNSPHAGTLFSVRSKLYACLSLTVEAVCRQYSFSAGYFRQIYKECFGVSFHQDAINARIYRAAALLSTTVLSIASVAEQCGYEDYNYFLRQFQKVAGMTPGMYRKRLT